MQLNSVRLERDPFSAVMFAVDPSNEDEFWSGFVLFLRERKLYSDLMTCGFVDESAITLFLI
jgi:hypothetical protein